MLTMSPLDEAAFDRVQVELTYYKLFSLILNDFVTRKDMIEIMAPSNLPVSTTVTTAVQVAPPTFTGAGIGAGNGQVTPPNTGLFPSAASKSMIAQYEAYRRSGGAVIDAMKGIG